MSMHLDRLFAVTVAGVPLAMLALMAAVTVVAVASAVLLLGRPPKGRSARAR